MILESGPRISKEMKGRDAKGAFLKKFCGHREHIHWKDFLKSTGNPACNRRIMQSKRRLYTLKTINVIIHNSWYFAHGVKHPRIIKSCKANSILNIAPSERWSATETDRHEGKI